MKRTPYFVVYHQNQWKISLEGKPHGPYATQVSVVTSAINAAHTNSSQARPSQVLVQVLGNQFRTEWSYGQDPYPPKG